MLAAPRVPAIVRTASQWLPGERDLLEEWAVRVTAAQHAHYYLMTRLRRRTLWMGIPVVVLTALVGTSLFATLSSSTNRVPAALRVTIGAVSVLASVLAALQTFLKFSERAEKHGLVADWFSAVRRDIDQMRATPEQDRGDPHEVLNDVRKEINKIVQNAPEIGEKVWHQFAVKYGAKEPYEV